MCKAKPGRRCSADTAKDREKLAAKINEAALKGDTRALPPLLDQLERTQLDYYGTRKGQAEGWAELSALRDRDDVPPNSLRAKTLEAQLFVAREMADQRDVAEKWVAAAPDEDRKHVAAAVERMMYADALRRVATTVNGGDQDMRDADRDLSAASNELKAWTRNTGMQPFPIKQRATRRCMSCGGWSDGRHACPGTPMSDDPDEYVVRLRGIGEAAATADRQERDNTTALRKQLTRTHFDPLFTAGLTDSQVVAYWANEKSVDLGIKGTFANRHAGIDIHMAKKVIADSAWSEYSSRHTISDDDWQRQVMFNDEPARRTNVEVPGAERWNAYHQKASKEGAAPSFTNEDDVMAFADWNVGKTLRDADRPPRDAADAHDGDEARSAAWRSLSSDLEECGISLNDDLRDKITARVRGRNS